MLSVCLSAPCCPFTGAVSLSARGEVSGWAEARVGRLSTTAAGFRVRPQEQVSPEHGVAGTGSGDVVTCFCPHCPPRAHPLCWDGAPPAPPPACPSPPGTLHSGWHCRSTDGRPCVRVAGGGLHRTSEEALRASQQGHHGHRASHRVWTPQAPIAGGWPSARAGTGASVLPPQVAWEGGGACAVLSGAPRPGGEGGQCQAAGLGPPAAGALSWLLTLDVGSTSQQAWARRGNEGQV